MTPEIDRLKARLHRHPLYDAIRRPEHLRTFMEHHVAAVWDFMSLLKSLQTELTSVRVPWTPPADAEAARMINEIVLGEETDEIAPGRHGSHFEWYLTAMEEVGAETGPIRTLLADVGAGAEATSALGRSTLPESAVVFSDATLRALEAPIHVRAAVFLHGRENLIPTMFVAIVENLERGGLRCDTLLAYLKRHIEVDSGEHGPLAAALLDRLHAGDPEKEQESAAAVRDALLSRLELWDAALEALSAPALR